MNPRVIRTYAKKSKSWDAGLPYHSKGDRSSDVQFLYHLARPTGWHLEVHWQMVKIKAPLDESIRRLLTLPTTKLPGKDGRPAFLARAVLAALLGTRAEKILDFFGNYRRRLKASARS